MGLAIVTLLGLWVCVLLVVVAVDTSWTNLYEYPQSLGAVTENYHWAIRITQLIRRELSGVKEVNFFTPIYCLRIFGCNWWCAPSKEGQQGDVIFAGNYAY